MDQPGIGDLRVVAKDEVRELGQPLQMHQPMVGDSSRRQVEDGEVVKSVQMSQPGVGDLCKAQVEDREFGQPLQMG